MITLKFLASPDSDILREFEFLFDSITLGSGRPANLIVRDTSVLPLHIRLQVIDNKLFIHGENITYTVNGKKLSGNKYCLIGDVIGIGDTSFKLISFLNTQIGSEEKLRAHYKELEDTRPDITMLLEALEHELLKLQIKENNNQKSS